MKPKKFLYLTTFCILLISGYLHAEEPAKMHSVSLHIGYANMPGGTAGLTNTSHSYEWDLCSGISCCLFLCRLPTVAHTLSVLFSVLLFLVSRSSNFSALINFLTLSGISSTDFQNIPEAELPPPDILPLPGESVPAP